MTSRTDGDEPVLETTRRGPGGLGIAAIIVGIGLAIIAVRSIERALGTGRATTSWFLVPLAIVSALGTVTCFGYARWRIRHRRSGTFPW